MKDLLAVRGRRPAASLATAARMLAGVTVVLSAIVASESSLAQVRRPVQAMDRPGASSALAIAGPAPGRPGTRPGAPGTPAPPRRPIEPDPVAPPAIPLAAGVSDADFRRDLAYRWAPIHIQKVKSEEHNDSEHGRSDWLSAVDYDGDWNTTNNWEHAEYKLRDVYPRRATVYYSVAESSTHWFLIYAFYHPRDQNSAGVIGSICGIDLTCDKHENDMEGVIMAIERPSHGVSVTSPADIQKRFGTLKAMSTVCHTNFLGYVPSGSSWRPRVPDPSPPFATEAKIASEWFGGFLRPITYQEAQGHCARGRPTFSLPFSTIKYVPAYPAPSDATQPPATGDVPRGNTDVTNYALVDIHSIAGFWVRRASYDLMTEDGHFRGDNGVDDAAATPWAWDHKKGLLGIVGWSDEGLGPGAPAYDPAALIEHHFEVNDGPAIDHRYSWMPYCRSSRPCNAEQERVFGALFPPSHLPPYVPPGAPSVCDRKPTLPQCAPRP